ncbi:Imm32 family immunity protein, partial [Actinokineospora xionganensis]
MLISDLEIRYSPRTREIDISSSRQSLKELARLIAQGEATISSGWDQDPAPYASVLSTVICRVDENIMVVFDVQEEEGVLTIVGDAQSMTVLAQNIEGFAEDADARHHLHVDYFPEHPYLERRTLGGFNWSSQHLD